MFRTERGYGVEFSHRSFGSDQSSVAPGKRSSTPPVSAPPQHLRRMARKLSAVSHGSSVSTHSVVCSKLGSGLPRSFTVTVKPRSIEAPSASRRLTVTLSGTQLPRDHMFFVAASFPMSVSRSTHASISSPQHSFRKAITCAPSIGVLTGAREATAARRRRIASSLSWMGGVAIDGVRICSPPSATSVVSVVVASFGPLPAPRLLPRRSDASFACTASSESGPVSPMEMRASLGRWCATE